jgi:hypothetical protein
MAYKEDPYINKMEEIIQKMFSEPGGEEKYANPLEMIKFMNLCQKTEKEFERE